MSRRYSPEQKKDFMDRLIANGGDVQRTSAETGVPVRTLNAWLQNIPGRQQQQQQAPVATTLNNPSGILNDQILIDLRQRLIDNINALVDSLEAAIEEAPLNQRASALGQLIDRLMRLSERLPQASKPPQKIRIEFVDEKGNVHDTLPESGEDSDE